MNHLSIKLLEFSNPWEEIRKFREVQQNDEGHTENVERTSSTIESRNFIKCANILDNF